jgi:3-dehydroquinate dehydratase
MSDDASIIPVERVEQSIYLIRGHKVMLDRDLAALYGVETKALNQAVKRNTDRFPSDFVFRLSDGETKELVTICDRFLTLKHSVSNPLAFTEQGVAMLSGVLRSPRAVEVNIAVMRTFVKMRRMLESSEELSRKLAELESRYDEQFRVVFEAIHELMIPPEPKKNPIGFHVNEEPGVYTVRKIS